MWALPLPRVWSGTPARVAPPPTCRRGSPVVEMWVVELFLGGDVMPGPGRVGVAEADRIHGPVDPQDLVLDAPAALDGEPEQLLDLGCRRGSVWMDQFHQT